MELFGRNLRSLVTCPTPTSRQIPVRDNTRYRFGVALHGHGTPYFTSLMIPPRRYLLVPHSSLLLAKAGAGLFQLVVTEFVFSKIINYATLRAAQVKAKVRDWLTPFAWELNYVIVARELTFLPISCVCIDCMHNWREKSPHANLRSPLRPGFRFPVLRVRTYSFSRRIVLSSSVNN